MNITRAKLKETLRTIVNEESEYQSFFKAALEKAGKSIPSMSDEEKKEFFNKIDAAWDAKGEKNEALVGGQKELDVDGDGDIEADDLADLRAGKKADESVTESTINESPSSEEIRIAMLAVNKQKKYRRVTASAAVNDLMNSLEVIARDIKNGKIKDESVNEANTIGKMAKKYKNKDTFISAFFAHMKNNYGDSFKDFEKDKGYRDNIGKIWDDEHGIKESVNEGNKPKFKVGDMVKYKGAKVSAKVLKVIPTNWENGYLIQFQDNKKKEEAGESSLVKESVTEGKKVFKVNPGIGKAKYSISSHDGVKKHKDGSDFFDIEIFKNKVDLEKGIKNYTSKGFVKESVNESTKDDDYADELQKEVEKVLKGKNIKGWKLYVDSRSGTFEFEKNGIDLLIYATPMWDGNPNLPFNVMDGEGDNVNMIEKLIGNKLPFKPSYDLKKDISNYISVLTKILPKVEQAYGKLKKESVNEAPEGKKRFMFDFYTDSNQRSTEREVNFIAPNLEAAISEAESMCKKLKLGYVEIYYKDLFLGSMKQQNGFKFVEGRGYSKFKSTN